MKAEIDFQTKYIYDEPVSLSVHLYRLFPRGGRQVVVQEAEFQTNAEAQVSYQRDLFDNEVASCFHPVKTAQLATSLRLLVRVKERDPFDFLLAPHALEVPFVYTDDEARVLFAYRDGGMAPQLPFWQRAWGSRPTIETLLGLNQAFHQNLAYERREEGTARTPSETIAAGGGACRDFSVLLATTLRGLGLAARLVSGFVVETGAAASRADGALHEWVEVYLPGAGWLGLDPTNGVVCDYRHIATAAGLTAEHIAPTHGQYFHERTILSTMTSTVEVRVVG